MKKKAGQGKGSNHWGAGRVLDVWEEGGGGLSISGDWGPLMIMTLMIMTQQGHRSMQHVEKEAKSREMLKNQHFSTCQDVSYEMKNL